MASEESVPKDRFTIVNVGRLHKEKRYDRFVEVISELVKRGKDVDGWIVGQGEDKPVIEEQIRSLGLEDRITFWGFQRNPYKFMRSADLFLLTSDYEGFSLVTGEALSSGVPVVATEVTGPTEMIDGKNGVLVPLEVNSIADAVEKFIGNPDLVEEYRRRSLRSAAVLFDADATLRKIEDKLINPISK